MGDAETFRLAKTRIQFLRFLLVQAKFTICLFYSILCKRREYFNSCWLLRLLHRAACPSVFADRMSCRLVHDSLCVSHWAHGERRGLYICCFIYKEIISFSHTQTWETVGEKKGWKTERRKERYKQKPRKNADRKDWRNQRKNVENRRRIYCKQVEPLVPLCCSCGRAG